MKEKTKNIVEFINTVDDDFLAGLVAATKLYESLRITKDAMDVISNPVMSKIADNFDMNTGENLVKELALVLDKHSDNTIKEIFSQHAQIHKDLEEVSQKYGFELDKVERQLLLSYRVGLIVKLFLWILSSISVDEEEADDIPPKPPSDLNYFG